MDLKQQYPRTSSFNQLKNPLNIKELCNENDTFREQFFSSCTIIIKLQKFLSFGEPYCEGR